MASKYPRFDRSRPLARPLGERQHDLRPADWASPQDRGPSLTPAAFTAVFREFLIFAHGVENLESGFLLSFGFASKAAEVFLRGLVMSRNIGHRQGRSIRLFKIPASGSVPHRSTFPAFRDAVPEVL